MSQIRPTIIGLVALFCLGTQATTLTHKHSRPVKYKSPFHRLNPDPVQRVAAIPDLTATGKTAVAIPDVAKPFQGLLESVVKFEADLKAKHNQTLTLPNDDLLGATVACAEIIDSADEVLGQLESALPDQKQREGVAEQLSELLEKACGDDLFALSNYLIPGQEMALAEKLQMRFEKSNNEDIQALVESVATHVMMTAFERVSDPKKQKFAAVFPTVANDSEFMSVLYAAVRSDAGVDLCDYRIPMFARLSRNIWKAHLTPAVDFLKGDAESTVRNLINSSWQFKDLDFAELKTLEDGDFKKQLRLALALDDHKKAYADRAFGSIVNSAQHQLELSPRNIVRLQDAINKSLRDEANVLADYRQKLADMKAGRAVGGRKMDPQALAMIIPGIEAGLDQKDKQLKARVALAEPVLKRLTDGSCDVVMKMWTATDTEIKTASFQAGLMTDFQGKISAEDAAFLQQLLKALP